MPIMSTSSDTGIAEPEVEEEVEVKEPNFWHVILHNDDKTPMDIVVAILVQIFDKDVNTATRIMLRVHNNGKAIAGTYTHEVAEEKMNRTILTARAAGYPLEATIEEDE